MRRPILFFLFCFLCLAIHAQPPFTDGPPYPTPAPALDFVKFEYFIDIDPGFDNVGISSTAISGTDVVNVNATVTIPSTTLPGVHTLFVRSFVKSNGIDGKWSITNAYTFENLSPNYPNTPETEDLTSLEYFYDTDPGFKLGSPIPFAQSPEVSNLLATIAIPSLTPGVHQLFVRSRNAAKFYWSLTNSRTFENLLPAYPQPTAKPNIVKIEYFIDADPGIGNATTLAVTPSTNISDLLQSIDISSVENGVHVFFIRSLSNGWSWSLTNSSIFTNDGPLPISLRSFNGKALAGKNILTWRTASELNNSHFEIERAEEHNDLRFTKIGEVTGSGTKITDTDYTFADEKPHASKNYYRLKQVDFDGHFEYSSAILVEVSTTNSLANVYPNPANETLVIDYADKVGAQVVSFSVTDVVGRKMNVPYTEEEEALHCDVRLLPPGLYLLQIYFYGEKQTIRFMKE
jgi:Secretion system C-terminal sorting domain